MAAEARREARANVVDFMMFVIWTAGEGMEKCSSVFDVELERERVR